MWQIKHTWCYLRDLGDHTSLLFYQLCTFVLTCAPHRNPSAHHMQPAKYVPSYVMGTAVLTSAAHEAFWRWWICYPAHQILDKIKPMIFDPFDIGQCLITCQYLQAARACAPPRLRYWVGTYLIQDCLNHGGMLRRRDCCRISVAIPGTLRSEECSDRAWNVDKKTVE